MKPRQAPAGHVWQPGFARHVPWLPLTFFTVWVICCIGLGLVLYTSYDRPVEHWPAPGFRLPVSIILALLIAIANVSLGVCLNRGYEMAWWIKAVEGAELQTLRFDLGVQQTLGYMLGRGVAINQFSIAAVVALVVTIIDAPLIQRASRISAAPYVSAQTIPAYTLKGYLPNTFSSYGSALDMPTPMFSQISLAYQKTPSH